MWQLKMRTYINQTNPSVENKHTVIQSTENIVSEEMEQQPNAASVGRH